jgi:hypothetical protein
MAIDAAINIEISLDVFMGASSLGSKARNVEGYHGQFFLPRREA